MEGNTEDQHVIYYWDFKIFHFNLYGPLFTRLSILEIIKFINLYTKLSLVFLGRKVNKGIKISIQLSKISNIKCEVCVRQNKPNHICEISILRIRQVKWNEIFFRNWSWYDKQHICIIVERLIHMVWNYIRVLFLARKRSRGKNATTQ